MKVFCLYRLENDPDYWWACANEVIGWTDAPPESAEVRASMVRHWRKSRLIA